MIKIIHMSSYPLVVAATMSEIEISIPLLERHRIPYIVTGVGMTATTYALTKALMQKRYSHVIHVGIGGSFTRKFQLGDVVEVVQDSFSELGVDDNGKFITIDELNFGRSTWSKTHGEISPSNLPLVHGITVNTVHGEKTSIALLADRLPHVSIESMEGAAAFYVCSAESIPCIQVRSVSNYVEARDKLSWNIPLAVRKLNSWLQSYLEI